MSDSRKVQLVGEIIKRTILELTTKCNHIIELLSSYCIDLAKDHRSVARVMTFLADHNRYVYEAQYYLVEAGIDT